MNTSMGQVAFEATQQFLASNATGADGYGGPEGQEEWAEMPPVYREAWEAGAQAVLVEHDSHARKAWVAGGRRWGAGIALAPDFPHEDDGK